MQVPFLSFDVQNEMTRDNVLQAMTTVFDSKWYILGEQVERFEHEDAIFNGTNTCVTDQRDALQQYLAGKGVGTFIHYPVPPHLQVAYKHLGFQQGDFPIAERIADTCLSLPAWPGLTEPGIQYISSAIKAFFHG